MKYSLYTDGAYYPKINTVGIGGHLDDDGGKPIWDFSQKIDNPKITNQFKIQALVHGLNKCISNGIKEVECFTDDQTLAETINISDKVKKHNFIGRNPVFKELLSLLPKFDKIEFSYIPKNQNKIANSFARKLLVDEVVIANTVQTKSVEQGGFDLPNLLTKSKFTDKQEFMDAKVDIVKHLKPFL